MDLRSRGWCGRMWGWDFGFLGGMFCIAAYGAGTYFSYSLLGALGKQGPGAMMDCCRLGWFRIYPYPWKHMFGLREHKDHFVKRMQLIMYQF